MGIILCKGCGSEIAISSVFCSVCGVRQQEQAPAQPKKQSYTPIKVIAIIALTLASVFVIGEIKSSNAAREERDRISALPPSQRAIEERKLAEKQAEKEREPLLWSAKYKCEREVARSLHDPDSAQFEPVRSHVAIESPQGKFFVLVSVRAKNAFGAFQKAKFSCDVELTGKDTWKVTNLGPTNL